MNRKMTNRASDYYEADLDISHHKTCPSRSLTFIHFKRIHTDYCDIIEVRVQTGSPTIYFYFNTAYALLNIKYLLIGVALRDNGHDYARMYYLFRTEFPFIMNETPRCGVFTPFPLEVES